MIEGMDRLRAFAAERHAIYLRREAGGAAPWTDDPVLREFRFCNVYRELDRVTQWIHTRWAEPNVDDPDLWFAMVVARFINWPPTLEAIGYPVPWDREGFLLTMGAAQGRGAKLYTGAYMVRADPETPGEAKHRYQERVVFTPMWRVHERLRPCAGDSLNSYHQLLGQFHGLGSFMAGQVVADLRRVPPLSDAPDWWSFACSGPGSRRGLNRLLGRSVSAPWTEDDWRLHAERARAEFHVGWSHDRLHGQNFQNLLCEFDKYERARLGEGRPRARYRSQAA
jgi:hypothetical protein